MKWIVENSDYARERWLVDADHRLHGVCDYVGAKWHPPVQRYGMTDRQLRLAERIIDAGWLGHTYGSYDDAEPCLYRPENPNIEYWPEDRDRLLELLPAAPARCPKTKELPL